MPNNNLTSKDLLLQPFTIKDINSIFQLRSSPIVNRYIKRDLYTSIHQAQTFIEMIEAGIKEGKWYSWGIYSKEAPTLLLGTICLWNLSEDSKRAEIGYDLLPVYQGCGYMSQAMDKVIEFGFDLVEIEEIVAYTHHSNVSSLRLLRKFGFELQTNVQDNENPNNRIYRLTCKSRISQ